MIKLFVSVVMMGCVGAFAPPVRGIARRRVARCSSASAQLLQLVEPTDRGVSATEAQRARIDALIDECERSWAGCDAFAEPDLLYRNCEVVYVGQKKSEKANAAGGRFRGRTGRLLFQTSKLYQHILREDAVAGGSQKAVIAVNVIVFRLCGAIPGLAVLRGDARLETETKTLGALWNRTLSPVNTIRADFDPPRVKLGPFSLKVGPPSTVRLETTYLDGQVRISRGGSSGTPFVFAACALDDPLPEVWRAALARRAFTSRRASLAPASIATVLAFARRPLLATICALLALKLAISDGGIVKDQPGDRASNSSESATTT